MFIINHTNASQFADGVSTDGSTFGTGRIERDFVAMPVGSSPFAPAKEIKLIPWSDMSAAIKDQRARGMTNKAIILKAGYKRLNQQQTKYCWANAVINCMRYGRAFQNEPYADLSPASVAAPIRGYSNQGGLGIEALEYVAKHGACTTDVWAANAIDRSLDNTASRTNRANYTATAWYEAVAQNDGNQARARLQILLSLCINGHPSAGGFAWWGHEVFCVDAVEIEANSFGPEIENSWGESFGENGFATLQGDHAIPMDVVTLDAASAGVVAA